MERNSGKRGWIYYYETFRKLAQLTPLERGMLVDLAVPYSMPGDPAFEVEPDLEAIFPDATEDQMRLYRQSWAILAENAQDDDAKLKGKNTRRAYGAFKTNCITKGHIPEEDVIPFEEWEELGCPGWRQWDRLGRPLPPVQPLPIGASVTERDASAAVASVSVTERDGQDANNKNNSINNDTSKRSDMSKSTSVTPQGGETPPLPLTNALRAWREYQQEKYRPISTSAEKSLMGIMQVYAERYGAESVANLVEHCISEQWRNIHWERLDRDPDYYQRKGGGSDGHHGSGRASNGGNPSETGWSLPTVDLDAEDAD
ncbi:MAG: hypothetical protein IJT94_00300 [Oscillibacter sp.]|nr:hypothetical protein [Oscillibacter sp.]